jgi:hypothetical protein
MFKTWPLTLKEDKRFAVLENGGLWRTFGHNRVEGTLSFLETM